MKLSCPALVVISFLAVLLFVASAALAQTASAPPTWIRPSPLQFASMI